MFHLAAFPSVPISARLVRLLPQPTHDLQLYSVSQKKTYKKKKKNLGDRLS